MDERGNPLPAPPAEDASPLSAANIVRGAALLPAVCLYGLAWALSACVGLVVFGLVAGWRDMREFTDTGSEGA